MQRLVEYSSGEGSDSETSAVEATVPDTAARQQHSHEAAVAAAARGKKRCFEHVDGQWAATLMILGAC